MCSYTYSATARHLHADDLSEAILANRRDKKDPLAHDPAADPHLLVRAST
jgi:hypothetical protein